MGKDKSRSKMKKGVKKKTFLDNQKRHRNDAKVSKKKIQEENGGIEAPCPQYGRRAFRFQNFSDQVAGVDSSIVYQLAGRAAVQCYWYNSVVLVQCSGTMVLL